MRDAPGTRKRGSVYVVGLLCLIASLSYIDRYIIALLADPLMGDLEIDATQVGLLIGLGFGLLYALAGVPLAHLLDRGTRTIIVGIGVIAWSLSTVASGFAPNFEILLITRAGVAIGEAVLVPATVSLIADLFPPERRALPIGVFMAVSTLMSAGAFLVGGYAYSLASDLAPTIGLAPWRTTLILVGIPGLLVGPLWMMTVAEPARIEDPASAGQATAAATVAYLRRHWRFYLPFYLSFGISALASYSFITWTATMLARSYGQSLAGAGQMFGSVGLAAGLAGAIFWPAVSAWAIRRGRASLTVLALAVGLGIGNASVASFILANDVGGAIVLIATASFGYGAAAGLGVLIMQHVAPARMRARITSLYVLVGNIIGLACGPTFSAWLSDRVFSGPGAMRQSLSAIAAGALPLTVVLVLLAMASYAATMREADLARPPGTS